MQLTEKRLNVWMLTVNLIRKLTRVWEYTLTFRTTRKEAILLKPIYVDKFEMVELNTRIMRHSDFLKTQL